MNLIDVQDKLKGLSEGQLVGEMQNPSGIAPQFLVLSEIARRKRIRDDMNEQNASDTTVAQDAVAAAGVPQGGISSMARALAPNTDMTMNTGAAPVQRMADGGYVRHMVGGGIADLQGNPTALAYAKKVAESMGIPIEQYLRQMSQTEADSYSRFIQKKNERNRMLGFEPVGESVLMPSQSDLDRRYQEEQFAFDVSRPMGPAPTLSADTGMPPQIGNVVGYPSSGIAAIGAPPSIGAAPSVDMPPQVSAYDSILMQSANAPQGQQYTEEDLRAGRTARIARGMEELRAERAPATPRQVDLDLTAGRESFTLGDLMPDWLGLPRDVSFGNGEAKINPREGYTGAPVGMTAAEVEEAARKSAEEAAAESEAAGVTQSLRTPDQIAAAAEKAKLAVDATRTQAPKAPLEGDTTTKTTPPADVISGTTDTGKPVGGTGGSGVSSGGAGAAAPTGATSYEQELISAMQRADRRAEQDKWLSLAQVGLNLMSSTQPTLGGAIGEAGIAGLQSYRGARDEYEKERLGLTKELSGLQAARASALASQRAAAAKKNAPLSLSDTLAALAKKKEYLYDTTTDLTGAKVTTLRPGAEGSLRQINAEIDRLIAASVAPTM